jgi:DNA primase
VEVAAVILMLAIGVGIALAVIISFAAAQREAGPELPDRDRVAASILFNVLLAGGVNAEEAFRQVRRGAGIGAPVTGAIDISNWGQRYSQIATPEQRAWLLETAVKLVADRPDPVPLRQYSALLDLSFALGFQTDALAKLREQYGFEYIDHAKNARPREADRAGGAMTLFARDDRKPAELLRVLGIEGEPSRQGIISAYRKLAAQHHPDRFHAQTAETQSEAAARFIEITRAYEALLAIYRE